MGLFPYDVKQDQRHSEGKLMRATITVLLIILPVLILGCTLNQRAPTRDMEATSDNPDRMPPWKLRWRPKKK